MGGCMLRNKGKIRVLWWDTNESFSVENDIKVESLLADMIVRDVTIFEE